MARHAVVDAFKARDMNVDIESVFSTKLTLLRYSQPYILSGKAQGTVITAFAAGHTDTEDIDAHLSPTSLFMASTDSILPALLRPSLLIASTRLPSGISTKTRDAALFSSITATLHQGGNVLIPTDASSRVLELAHILEDHWHANGLAYPVVIVSHVAPKWYADQLTKNFASRRVHAFDFTYYPDPKVVLATDPEMDFGFARKVFVDNCNGSARNLVVVGERLVSKRVGGGGRGQRKRKRKLRNTLLGTQTRARSRQTCRAGCRGCNRGWSRSRHESSDQHTGHGNRPVCAAPHEVPVRARGRGQAARGIAAELDGGGGGDSSSDEDGRDGVGDDEENEMDPAKKPYVPTKIVEQVTTLDLHVRVKIVDARAIALVGGSAADTDIQREVGGGGAGDDDANAAGPELFAPETGTVVEPQSASYAAAQVKLTDALFTRIKMVKYGEHEIGVITAAVKNGEPHAPEVAAANESNGATEDAMDVDVNEPADQVAAAAAMPPTRSVPVLDVIDALHSQRHPSVVIGTVRLTDFKSVLDEQGFATEFVRGCWSSNGHITVEGQVCPEYYSVRKLLYQQHVTF
ncbi:beta-lactamase-like protein [Catenaria anguillulae PL171]|uniref:Cleavage and polyadenylation specificity factor subunit 2 n=1 Tax=Catenaria anguillulae PL171 TaxID=765915 RepID=A0A1Y2HZB8_9FUNG|nr:beta-lactamase-like protein [Catenaria anguillulae PL171]